jgi:hypothetical protein
LKSTTKICHGNNIEDNINIQPWNIIYLKQARWSFLIEIVKFLTRAGKLVGNHVLAERRKIQELSQTDNNPGTAIVAGLSSSLDGLSIFDILLRVH